MSTYNTIKYDIDNGIGYVKIDRPEALNALNDAVLTELDAVFEEIKGDDDVRVVILTGEGKAFVAGADIVAMSKLDPVKGRDFFIKGQAVMDKIETLEKPVIAAINGYALGGGCELAMACDIRFASEKAVMGQPEVKLGIIPGFGGTQRLPRLVGKGMAKYLIMGAENIKADEALRIGLVEKVFSPEDLMAEAEAFAKKLIANSPIGVKLSKVAINTGVNTDLRSGVAFEAEAMMTAFTTEDRVEGMDAFINKRNPEFKNK